MDVDRRKSQRVAYEGFVPATVRVGRRRLDCRLLNESAEGFCFTTQRDPGVQGGDVVHLSTSTGTWMARVVRVARKGNEWTVGCDRGDGAFANTLLADEIPLEVKKQASSRRLPALIVGGVIALLGAFAAGYLLQPASSEPFGAGQIATSVPKSVKEAVFTFRALEAAARDPALQLTPVQHFRMLVVLDETSRILKIHFQDRDSEESEQTQQERTREILEQAELRIADLLDEAQQQCWRQLRGRAE